MTIFLTGSINLLTQEEIQREAERYAANGWEYRDPTTHRVSVQIAQQDLEAFCDYLRCRPLDRQPKVWRDRDGNSHETPTVTFFLNGSEMTGNWIRLRSALHATPQAGPSAAAPAQQPARRAPAPAPVRRSTAPSAPVATAPPPVAVPHSPATPDRPPLWSSAPLDPEDDDDIPF